MRVAPTDARLPCVTPCLLVAFGTLHPVRRAATTNALHQLSSRPAATKSLSPLSYALISLSRAVIDIAWDRPVCIQAMYTGKRAMCKGPG